MHEAHAGGPVPADGTAWYRSAMSCVVLRYHEILLKRGNRHRFTAQLARNVRRACADLPLGKVTERHGRLVAEVEDDAAWPAIRERIARVYGLANFSFARRVPLREPPDDLEPLADALLAALAGRAFGSFRVDTRRADKRFPLPSPEVNARLGARIQHATGARVDLEHADVTLTVEILPGEVLWTTERIPGAGGLPVGTSDPVLALLSGGIDSPVAAMRLMRRGSHVHFVHFHGAPYLDRSSQEKCRELVRRMVAWQPDTRLVVVPFGEVQKTIVTAVPPAPRVILYRRMMMRIACEVARRLGARALVTGDSLAQVASQTLANLAVVEEASDLLVLRPLIGMDKTEITDEARRAGTFEISIEPDQDCCSLFVPRHPTTRARFETIRRAERALDVPALVAAALSRAEVERWVFPPTPREPVREALGDARPLRGGREERGIAAHVAETEGEA